MYLKKENEKEEKGLVKGKPKTKTKKHENHKRKNEEIKHVEPSQNRLKPLKSSLNCC